MVIYSKFIRYFSCQSTERKPTCSGEICECNMHVHLQHWGTRVCVIYQSFLLSTQTVPTLFIDIHEIVPCPFCKKTYCGILINSSQNFWKSHNVDFKIDFFSQTCTKFEGSYNS